MLDQVAGASDKKALLVLMPWASPEFPGLGPSLLYSILNHNGVPADILYANLVFSKLIEADPFVEKQLSKLPICEIAFSPYYFDMPAEDAARQLRDYAAGLAASPDQHTIERYLDVVDIAGRCLDEIFATTPWDDYDVVGFSVMMQQTVASLALARRLKKAYPHLTIVFGGPSTSMPMGAELLRSFPEIDYGLTGEADSSITPLVRRIREGTVTSEPRIPGLLYRDADGAVQHVSANPAFFRLDQLPIIDYAPYFAQIEAAGLQHVEPSLQIETSRGCWWGAKHHCKFCGIEDAVLQYRSKNADQVLEEMLELSARHQRMDFFCVDSILDHRAFGSLLPKLAELRTKYEYDFNIFVESKSNLKRRHASLMRAAGISSVQPGLESFSDHVLELMDKGTTGARQIQCLKVLEENGVFVNWNLIYENIGETVADYREIADVIPYVQHLLPLHGEGLIPMQLNRFAPYHETPEQFEISNIRAKAYYRYVFPDPSIDLDRLAFYFDFDRADPPSPELRALHLELGDLMDEWAELYRPESLMQRRGPGFVEIIDRRAQRRPDATIDDTREEVHLLDGVWAEIFVRCDEVVGVDKLVREFAGRVPAEELRAFVDRLHSQRLVYRSPSGQVVNLPMLPEARLGVGGEPESPAAKMAVPASLPASPPASESNPVPVSIASAPDGEALHDLVAQRAH